MNAKELLEAKGATDIKGYMLVNNYGYDFTLDGHRYDARFVANCYGATVNRWDVKGFDNIGLPRTEIEKELMKELNALGN